MNALSFSGKRRLARLAALLLLPAVTARAAPLMIGSNAFEPYDTAIVAANGGYYFTLEGYGGAGPYTFGCTFPAPLSGLSCATDGSVSGTIAAPTDGNYSVTVSLSDGGAPVNKTLPLQVVAAPVIHNLTVAEGYLGVDYGRQSFSGGGGTGPTSWAITGALPPGLSLDTVNGFISGTPTMLGSYPFTLVYNAPSANVTRNFTLIIRQPVVPPFWIRRGLAGGHMGALYFSPNFALDRTLIATRGDAHALFLSTDGGYFWRPMNFNSYFPAGSSNAVKFVDFSPGFDGRAAGTDHTLAVATTEGGVYYSTDLDASWTQHTGGLGGNGTPGTFFADNLIFAPDFASTQRLYCLSYSGTALRLFSGVVGAGPAITWSRLSPLPMTVRSFRLSPDFINDRQILASGADKDSGPSAFFLFRSLDGGVTWSNFVALGVETYLTREGYAFSPGYATDRALAYINFNRLYFSTNDGASFTLRPMGLNANEAQFPPDYHPLTNPTLYVIGFNGANSRQVLVSRDNGLSFNPSGNSGMPLDQVEGFYLFISPDFATDGLMLTPGRGAVSYFRTEDRGATWGPSDGGLYLQAIKGVAYAPDFATSRMALLGTEFNLYSTRDAGKTWQKVPVAGNGIFNAYSIAFSPNFATDRKVFVWGQAENYSLQVLRSNDGGASFTPVYTDGLPGGDDDARRLQISPDFANDQRVYIISAFHLHISYDEGVSFDPRGSSFYINLGNYALSPGFATDHYVYTSKYNGTQNTYSPVDYNYFDVTTAPMGTQAPALPPQYNHLTGVNGQLSHSFFWNCGYTTDDAATFTAIPPSGAGCHPFGALYMSPTYGSGGDTVLFSTVPTANVNNPLTGLYKTVNGGSSFTRLSVPGNTIAFDEVRQVALAPNYNSSQAVMVATTAGLYISGDGGATWTLSTGTEAIAPDVSAVTQDINTPGRLYVGTQSGKVFMSSDDGITATEITGNLAAGAVRALITDGAPSALMAATGGGIFRRGDFSPAGTWSLATGGGGDIRSFSRDSAVLFAARANGASLTSSGSGGASWTALNSALLGDGASIVRVPGGAGAPPFLGTSRSSNGPAGSNAGLWAASLASGARASTDGGATWIATPGGNDYTLPALSGGLWSAIQPLGINAASGGREVLIGNNGLAAGAGTRGLFLTRDGGDSWRRVSGAGSGLESTSLNVSALLTAPTLYGTTDLLAGINGTTNGGVYLSGDGGEHWTQINQGFDPNSLNISTLVKTSCSGCPVQYYSGTYGSGVYTRTIAVTPAPAFPLVNYACYNSTVCACATGGGSGPEQGGQPFKLCGSNFQNLAVVEFGGVPAAGCAMSAGGTVITCAATPPHVPGGVTVRVRNPDTRAGVLPASYTYTSGTPRTGNLKITRTGFSDATLTWNCPSASCTAAAPARVYRSQNGPFTLNVEQYNGGASNISDIGTWTNLNALAAGANSTYFWRVE